VTEVIAEKVLSGSTMPIVSINPANGETIEQYEEMSTEQVDAIIDQCHQAFLDWRDVPFAERRRRNAAGCATTTPITPRPSSRHRL